MGCGPPGTLRCLSMVGRQFPSRGFQVIDEFVAAPVEAPVELSADDTVLSVMMVVWSGGGGPPANGTATLTIGSIGMRDTISRVEDALPGLLRRALGMSRVVEDEAGEIEPDE